MHQKQTRRVPVFASFLISTLALSGDARANDRALHYRFRLGEALVYELVSQEDLLEKPEEKDRRYETEARWTVYPVHENDDGVWRLVVQTAVRLLRYDREETDDESLGPWQDEPHVRLENNFLGYCDLAPDGSYAMNPTLGHMYIFELLPEMIFVPLPTPGVERAPVSRTAPTSDTVYTLGVQSSDENEAVLTGSLERPLSDNYEATNTLEIAFDTAAGRLRQIVETTKSEWEAHPSHRRTTYELVGVEQHTPEWTADFAAAADAYFEDRNHWWEQKTATAKTRSEAECRELVDLAREQLVVAQHACAFEEVRAAYDGLVGLHDREAEWDLEAAVKRERLYTKAPVEWVTTNLEGTPRRRSDYDGRVVLMDFWYRGCGHCVLAMPKVKTLYKKYQDRGVVFLGVSNDRNVDDALHVVRTYSLPYESVRNYKTDDASEPVISPEYEVTTWPTFVVLDQRGRIAEIVAGNAEDLVEHMSEVIDRLLGAE